MSYKEGFQSDVRRVTYSGRPQGVSFEHKYETHLCGNIFSFIVCIRY